MYFKTEHNSETGKKFQELKVKADLANKTALELAKKYGFSEWRPSRSFKVFGGISSFASFNGIPDPKVWCKSYVNGEYYPKGNSKKGKEILKEIESLPTVSARELNGIIGWNEKFSWIGCKLSNKSFFGFIVDRKVYENLGDNFPKDCIEITETEYLKL